MLTRPGTGNNKQSTGRAEISRRGYDAFMLNGKTDGIVKPDWAKRLYAAAPEPKSQVWYVFAHFLPAGAFGDAAKWIAQTTGKEPLRP